MLIGLTGYKQSGKSTVANLLISEFGFVQVSFADALRKLAYDINPVVGYALQQSLVIGGKPNLVPLYYAEAVDGLGYEKAKSIDEVRRYLQRLGTEGIRNNFGPDVWVEIVKQQYLAGMTNGANVVIPDVRFPNEAAFVRGSGQLWRINRPGFGSDGHASESHIADMVVDHDITATEIEDLRNMARFLYNMLRGE